VCFFHHFADTRIKCLRILCPDEGFKHPKPWDDTFNDFGHRHGVVAHHFRVSLGGERGGGHDIAHAAGAEGPQIAGRLLFVERYTRYEARGQHAWQQRLGEGVAIGVRGTWLTCAQLTDKMLQQRDIGAKRGQ
jgi:hypothetical protein